MATKEKKQRFTIDFVEADEQVTWTDKTNGSKLSISLDEIPAQLQTDARLFFTCYGMQKFHEDRTSGAAADEKFTERNILWDAVCENGHTYKKPKEGGIGAVSCEIEALADYKKVKVSAIQKERKNFSKEDWAKILEHPEVVKRAAEIKAKREDAEAVSLEDMLAAPAEETEEEK